MVATAGAGAAASSMKIKGTMDTSNIDRGFTRVNQDFEGFKGRTKSFGSDMQRVAGVVGGLAKKLITLGTVGATAIIGIASKAPAIAPAMAKMSVAFGQIQRSLGEALAPAFEKVSIWLDKLATWVDANKEKIGDMAIKFLDWGAALAEKVWPVLKDIGNWAVEHPGLFAGIVAGLALAPAVISGIASLAGLVTILGATAVSPTLLAAFAYIALIGAAAVGAHNVIRGAVERVTGFLRGEAEATPGSIESLRVADTSAAEIAAQGYQPTPGGAIHEGEARRAFYLQLWDAVWP